MNSPLSFAQEPPADHQELLARIRFSLDEPMRISDEALADRRKSFTNFRSMTRANCVRVTAKLMPKVYTTIKQACENLLLTEEPEVYVESDPAPNAGAMTNGEEYFIKLHSGLIQLLAPEELAAIVGHEIGHASMRHMIEVPENERQATFTYERRRAQEISADRAGLLAVSDPMHALRAEIKVACGLGSEHFTADIDAFIEQISTPPDDLDAPWEADSTHPTIALRFWAQRHFMESDLFHGLKGQTGGRVFDDIEREIEERFHSVGSSAAFRATADHVHESLAWLGILAVAHDGELSEKEHAELRHVVGHIWADDAFAYAKRHGIKAVERRAMETLAPLRFSNNRARRRLESALRELVERASVEQRLEGLLRIVSKAMEAS
jgi:hypothetical protein